MSRETFTSRLGLVATMIGVAVGLGNVWRFPYMVGRFGGAAFVVVYLLLAVLIGIPALMAEWTLGRHTRRGSVGAFELAGLPGGRALGWIFFFAVATATGYYSNAIGWVIYHGAAELARGLGMSLNASRILPPDTGFDAVSFRLQVVSTGLVIAACGLVLRRGLRSGIQKASMVITPLLFGILLLLVVRSLTLAMTTAPARKGQSGARNLDISVPRAFAITSTISRVVRTSGPTNTNVCPIAPSVVAAR